MPFYYGGDLNDSDCEIPGDNDYDTWEECDSDIRDRYCGFPPDDEETQLPVIICAPVFRGKTCVAFEGFVLYAGGDYTLYPNIMLLVRVMAYVMSGMFAADIVG